MLFSSFVIAREILWTCHAKGSARGTTESEKENKQLFSEPKRNLVGMANIRVAERWYGETDQFGFRRGYVIVR